MASIPRLLLSYRAVSPKLLFHRYPQYKQSAYLGFRRRIAIQSHSWSLDKDVQHCRVQPPPLLSSIKVNSRPAPIAAARVQTASFSTSVSTNANNVSSPTSQTKDILNSVKEATKPNAPAPALSSLPLGKKRTIKRKQSSDNQVVQEEEQTRIWYPIVAYATCNEIHLRRLRAGLIKEGLYIPTVWSKDSGLEDVIHATAKYVIGKEPREMFFFEEGTVVFWNVPESERACILRSLKAFEHGSFSAVDVMQESEYILYSHSENRPTHLLNGKILLKLDCSNLVLEKYTIANAMAQSVKLGIWESSLERFVESIDHVTEELKSGKHIKLTRAQVLQKTGELFGLRNELNLNSDLLDTPDFYWEHENLEALYHKLHNYLSITRRTDVMNEKLTQCYELLELISGHLNDKHHVRLEWMIIALITVEVFFEIAHMADRYQLI